MIFKPKKTLLNDEIIEDLSKKTNLSNIATKILFARGYDDEHKINKFLNPSIDDLNDPYLLKDMDVVVDKIKKVVESKKKVLIFGDYDVDGISATAILYKYFESKGIIADTFLPNRYEDGYGLTMDTAKKILDTFKPEFIITVDCGISCYKEIEFLMQNGVDVVVTDHHELPEILPSCPIVNPKRTDQEYPFKDICGAGVAFKLVQALGENLDYYFPICAIATIADIVSLTDENRAIVSLGLKQLDKLPKGVKILIDELNLKDIKSGDIAFKVAPKINAAGRMGDASIALKLYTSSDDEVINNSLKLLNEMNSKRQELCNDIYNSALIKIKSENQNRKRAIILNSNNWDSGLVGIVCARLTDEFNKPTFLFSEVDGLLKGSVRSIPNINIHEVLSASSTLLETFGGHSMAAGLTLKKENFEKFSNEIENYLIKKFTNDDFVQIKEYDLHVDMKDLSLQLAEEIESFEPFGSGNPRPLFYSKFAGAKVSQMKNFPQHLTITMPNNFTMACFNAGDNIYSIKNCYVLEGLFELQLNFFKGKNYLKGLLKNYRTTGYNDILKDFVNGSYLKELVFNKKQDRNSFYSYDSLDYTLNKLTRKSNYGTLIICNDLEKAKLINKHLVFNNFDFYIGKITGNTTNNSIVVGLSDFSNIYNYDNFLFLEPLLSMDYLNNFKGNLYLPKEHYIRFENKNINLSHEYFSMFYKKLYALQNKLSSENEYEYYLIFKRLCPELKNLNYEQFIVCIETFKELEFINENVENNLYSITFNENTVKKELTDAHFYNRINDLLEKNN